MGISDLFGFGKKEKPPFKAPREVAALRTRIESEQRENFPNIARYQEIVKDAGTVYERLNDLVLRKEYAAEAIKTRDELKSKLDALTAKIRNNIRESKKEGGQEYVEKNIDYLARKSNRDQAKTLYTEFLNLHERIITCCGEGPESSGSLESTTTELTRIIALLNNDFFKIYTQDREIQAIKEQALVRIPGLIRILEEHNACFEESGLASARTCALKLKEALKALSAV